MHHAQTKRVQADEGDRQDQHERDGKRSGVVVLSWPVRRWTWCDPLALGAHSRDELASAPDASRFRFPTFPLQLGEQHEQADA
jgi:hypothetical protein